VAVVEVVPGKSVRSHAVSGNTVRVRQFDISAEHRGEGKGCIIGSPVTVLVGRAGTAIPSDGKVVFGYATAIPAVCAYLADAGTGSRSRGRLTVMKPKTLGPRCVHRGPSV
jgi:hypothetical protein